MNELSPPPTDLPRQVHDEYTMRGGALEIWALPNGTYSIDVYDDGNGNKSEITITDRQFHKLARALAIDAVSEVA